MVMLVPDYGAPCVVETKRSQSNKQTFPCEMGVAIERSRVHIGLIAGEIARLKTPGGIYRPMMSAQQ